MYPAYFVRSYWGWGCSIRCCASGASHFASPSRRTAVIGTSSSRVLSTEVERAAVYHTAMRSAVTVVPYLRVFGFSGAQTRSVISAPLSRRPFLNIASDAWASHSAALHPGAL